MTRRTVRDTPPVPPRVYGVVDGGEVLHIHRPAVDGVGVGVAYCGRPLRAGSMAGWRVCRVCDRNAAAIETRETQPARQPREDGKS